MNSSAFIKSLIATIVISIALYYLLIQLFPSFTYTTLTWIAIGMFALISVLVFFLANKAINSDNKYSFLNIVVMNLFVKIMASFIIVVAYVKMTEPQDKWYLIPFTMIYLIFTIFETYFLSKAAKVQ